MTNEEKLQILEDIMELDSGDLTMGTKLEELEEWDSLAILSFIAMVKKKFNIIIPTEQIKDLKTVDDICSLI